MQTRTFSAFRANAVRQATVEVRVGSKTGPLAADLVDGNGDPLENPFPLPSNGRVDIGAPDGTYWINISGPGFSVWEQAQFLDAQTVIDWQDNLQAALDAAIEAAAAAVVAQEAAQAAETAAEDAAEIVEVYKGAVVDIFRNSIWLFSGELADNEAVPALVSESFHVIAYYQPSVELDTEEVVISRFREATLSFSANFTGNKVPLEVNSLGYVVSWRGMQFGLRKSVYIVDGALMVAGASNQVLNNDSDKTWLSACCTNNKAALCSYEDAGGVHAVYVSLVTANIWHAGDVILLGYGQSNAEGQATGTGLIFDATLPIKGIYMPRSGPGDVWVGQRTTGGSSVQLSSAAISGLIDLRDTLPSPNYGTTEVASFARELARRAFHELDLLPARYIVLTLAEGGQDIAYLQKGAAGSHYAYANIMAALESFKNHVTDLSLSAIFILMNQGESDTTDPDLGEKHNQIRVDLEADSGSLFDLPIQVYMTTVQPSSFYMQNSGDIYASSIGVRSLLHYDLDSRYSCAGPTYQFPWSSDYLHHTSVGHAMCGHARVQNFIDLVNGRADVLRMVAAAVTGDDEITVELSEEAVIDSSWLVASITNSGLLADGGTITGLVAFGNELIITVSGDASDVTAIRAGLVGHSGSRAESTIPRTNIRSVKSYGDYNGYPEYRALAHDVIIVS